MAKTNRVRLYRFYNINIGARGEPFAMCDKHKKQYNTPDNLILELIGGKTDMECDKCSD